MIAGKTGGAIRFALNSRACLPPRRTPESLITLLFLGEKKKKRGKKKHLLVFWWVPESKRSHPPKKVIKGWRCSSLPHTYSYLI